MHKLKLKSIRTLILVSILPLTLISMILLTLISYSTGKSIINNEINLKMNNQLDAAVQNIEKSLTRHDRLAQSLAKAAQSSGSILNKDAYVSMIKGIISTNSETYGAGIWFEPYKYDAKLKYSGLYAYRDGENIVSSDAYNTDSYNYFNQPWYKIGKDSDKDVIWSDAYYDDVAKLTMVTATAPFYDKNKNFIGAASADMNLTSLQAMIENIKSGKTGRAFLIDKDGLILAAKDTQKVMKVKITEDSNTSLAAKAPEMLKGVNGQFKYKENNSTYILYYMPVPETNWVVGITISEKELYAPIATLLLKLMIVIAGVIVFFIIVLVAFAGYLGKNIKLVNNLAFSIADGDLTSRLDVKTHDEIGQMAGHLNKMAENLNHVIKATWESLEQVVSTSEELTASSEQTQSAAEQIAVSMQDISTGAENQVSLTNSASEMVNKVSDGVQFISNNLQSISESSFETYEKAQDGNKVVRNAIEQMSIIDNKVSTSSNIVNDLGKKSNEIGEIISVITDITGQTNLLALNAAIEAARAGEHGRGFAVVAEEVKKLAEQSGTAANKIRELISDIQGNIKNAVYAMNDGTTAVKQGLSMVDDAGNSFTTILDAVDNISKKMQEATSISQEISASSHEISASIENIATISDDSAQNVQNVAASAEEQTAIMKEISLAAEELSHMALSLQNDLRRFKL